MTRLLPAVLLLVLPLGAVLAIVRGAEPAAPAAPAILPVDTEITAGSAEMISTDKETTFILRDRIKVTGTNIALTCDQLVVIMRRRGDTKATLGNPQGFKSLVATGSVRIVQGDREATCERAEIFPADDRVVLTGDPRVRTSDGQIQAGAPVMELLRGERMARMLSQDGQPVRFTLPPMRDLGFDPTKPKEPAKETPPTVPAPERPAAPAPTITVPLPAPKK